MTQKPARAAGETADQFTDRVFDTFLTEIDESIGKLEGVMGKARVKLGRTLSRQAIETLRSRVQEWGLEIEIREAPEE